MITPPDPETRTWTAHRADLAGAVTLVAQDGRPVTDADLAFVQAALDSYHPSAEVPEQLSGQRRGFVDGPLAGQPWPGERGAVGAAQREIDRLNED